MSSYMAHYAGMLTTQAQQAKADARKAHRSAFKWEQGLATHSIKLQIEAVMPYLVCRKVGEKTPFAADWHRAYRYGDKLEFSLKAYNSNKGIDPSQVSVTERDLLLQLRFMKPGEYLYILFWSLAAPYVANMPVDVTTINGDWHHYANCNYVAGKLWPETTLAHASREGWVHKWEDLKTRLRAIQPPELADA